MINIIPVNNQVIVKLQDGEETTKGGIVLAPTAIEQTHYADVIAVSDGDFNQYGQFVKPKVKVGDVIVISGKWIGERVKVDNEEYIIVDYFDILGVVKDG